MPSDTATAAAAIARPPPIMTLRLDDVPFLRSFIAVPLGNAHGWRTRNTLALCREPRPFLELALITPASAKSWSSPSRGARSAGNVASTEAINPSGGYIFGTLRKRSNTSRISSKRSLAAGSDAMRASTSRASSGVASPSRTVCIKTSILWALIWSPFALRAAGPIRARGGPSRSCRPIFLQELAQALACLEKT